MDVSYPSDLLFHVGRLNDLVYSGDAVVWHLQHSIARPGEVIDPTALQWAWTVPPLWEQGQTQRLTFDDGTGHTFPAHSFTHQDLVGIALQRNGANGADDFNQSVVLAAAATLEYTKRCGWPCCI